MKVSVIGTGYVGLVVGTCLAESGNDVVCVDSAALKIDALKAGRIPIYEPGLEELVERNAREGRLEFTTDLPDAVRRTEIVFIAVGTPSAADGSADLSAVFSVAGEIAGAMDGYRLVVTKSTVPVGTAGKVAGIIAEQTDHPFDVASNPEFMKEGAAVDDFMKPDRVVVGTDSERARETLRELYSPFVRTGAPILMMNPRSAEMTKYAANCMLACRISLMNEFARLADGLGADISSVREAVGFDSRIGSKFLFPGLGYGGSCFPKDVRAMIMMGRTHGVPVKLLEGVDEVNEAQKNYFVPKIIEHFGGSVDGRKIAVWGIAFKPRTDDIREAASLVIIEALLGKGARVSAYDPEATDNARRVLGDRVDFAAAPYEALAEADALVVITEWNEFRRPDYARMKELMKTPVVFDGRNIYSLEVMEREGFTYYGVGRGGRGGRGGGGGRGHR